MKIRMSAPGMKESAFRRPWEIAERPFRVAPHIYFVGNQWVSAYLLVSEEGLALIDTTVPSTLYLLLESIRSLGYDPMRLKHVFLSHGHYDHDGCAMHIRKMTGASIWLSEEEQTDFRKNASIPEGCKLGTPDYEPDRFYDDRPILLGPLQIRVKLTPGHTPGTVSFFIRDHDETGKEWLLAMHGGVGANTMNPAYFAESGLPEELAYRFVRDCEEMKELPVDICVPSHPPHMDFLNLVGSDRNDYSPFADRTAWRRFLEERAEVVREVMRTGRYPL